MLILSANIATSKWAGIASDLLGAGWSGDRIPVWMRFSAPVQIGLGAYPASYTVGTGSFPGVKRAERDVDHLPYLAPRLKNGAINLLPL